jgi:hypothetical protein
MSRDAFSYTVLRYIHDVSTGEFLNVGVVVFVPSQRYVRAKMQREYERLSSAFEGFHGEYYRALVRHVESKINALSDRWQRELPFDALPVDAQLAASMILPKDDSSLQFSEPGGGLTDDPNRTLEELFHGFVIRNQPHRGRECRDNEEVWKAFKEHFTSENVLSELHPVSIKGASFDYEFDHAWKNKRWHPLEPLSMDAVEDHTLRDRASRWVGRAMDLQVDETLGTLHLLVGPPQLERLKVPYAKALDLLHKMPIDHEIVEEDDAAEFARRFGREVRQHEERE